MATAAAMSLVGAAVGCSPPDQSDANAESDRPVVAEVVTVEAGRIRDVLRLVGELRAAESVFVRPEIAAMVTQVEFLEGQTVEQGDVLFRLADGEQVARLREAEARHALAADEYKRTERLARRNAAAAAQLERATAELDAARARADLAQVELERTRIRAPFDGVIGARLVSPGARVTPDDELVRIDAIHRLQLAFTAPEWAVPRLRSGLPVAVSVSPYPRERFPGEIFFVAPSVNQKTRRIDLKAWVPNPEHRLRPGLFAQVELEFEVRDALLVPEEAIVHDRTGPFVWRLREDDTAQHVGVEVGERDRGRVEIRSGLRSGDRIVSAGTQKVSAGVKVEAVARSPGEPGAAAERLGAPALPERGG